jgi:uncharacterized protein with PIN domain
MKSTPKMRQRARELALPIRDDFDRAVIAILDDFAELEKQVYVPGLWRCPKCEFQLVQANLYAATGAVSARDQPGDKCPNCNGPLWRVTERQAGNDMVKRCEEQMERAIKAETKLKALTSC